MLKKNTGYAETDNSSKNNLTLFRTQVHFLFRNKSNMSYLQSDYLTSTHIFVWNKNVGRSEGGGETHFRNRSINFAVSLLIRQKIIQIN